MSSNLHALPGAYSHVHMKRILPTPSADILRRLNIFITSAGLAYDAFLTARDPRLQHCILLPTAGVLVTATRASAPLLGSHCADIARITNLDVLLLRFGSQLVPDLTIENAGACFIRNSVGGTLVAHEGYRAVIPAFGGILLRHPFQHVPEYQIGNAGMWAIDDRATS